MPAATFLITFLTYVVAGAVPPIFAHFAIRADFLGGAPVAILVGVIAAVVGGLVDTLLLTTIPDLIVIGGAVDVVPPLVASIALTTIFALVSSSN